MLRIVTDNPRRSVTSVKIRGSFCPNVTGFDLVRFNFAEKSQAFAGHTIKVAVVARPEHLDTQRFGELVARNRGVNLRGFTDYQAAEKWLLE